MYEDRTVEREELGPLTLRVVYDDSGMGDPRDNDNLGVMVCAHRRYDLGDVQASEGDVDRYGSVLNYLIAEHDAIRETVMPLYLFDHSGLSISTDASGFRQWDAAGWDWGLVGFTFATPASIEMTGCSGDDWPPEKVRESLAQEVKEYDSFLRGDVYGYVIEKDGDVLDSCWGYIGDTEYPMQEARAVAESTTEYQRAVVGAFAGSEGLGL